MPQTAEQIGLYVSIPVACFRVPRAREYFETYPLPPPATVYGMLLSMVGETNRRVHESAQIAIALISEPAYSTVLRTLWRVKNKNDGLGSGGNRRPDFQELLTDVKLIVWIRSGSGESSEISLMNRVRNAFANPNQINRFGGLSLGESTHLVDEIKLLENFEVSKIETCQILLNEESGDLSLPIWADHVGAASVWGQYRLTDFSVDEFDKVPVNAWTIIRRESVSKNPPQTSQESLF